MFGDREPPMGWRFELGNGRTRRLVMVAIDEFAAAERAGSPILGWRQSSQRAGRGGAAPLA
jgi:hypothetical protein